MFGYIYKTINLTNCKIYIGQHKSDFHDKSYLGSGIKLLNAVNKYGKNYFANILLCECSSKEELDEAERHYINLYNSTDDKIGYNIAIGGSGVPLKECTPGHRKNISNAKKGKPFSEKTKQLMSIQRKGCRWVNDGNINKLVRRNEIEDYLYEGSDWKPGICKRNPKSFYRDETRNKISSALKGKKKSKEAVEAHRQSLKSKHRHWYTNGENNLFIEEGKEIPNGFYPGKFVTEEFKNKVSNSCKGRIPWNKGKHKQIN